MLSEKSIIKKGTVIMEAEPFVYVLQEKFQSLRCDYCLSDEKDMHKCAGCHYVYYCNRNCQKKAWKIHKSECKNMRRCQPLTLSDTARLMARIIIKFRDGEGTEKGYYMTNKHRTFKDMMSHSAEIKQNANKMEHLFSLKCVLDDFFGKDVCVPEFEELLEIYGRINTNAFHISHNIENFAIGIYLGPSILDHSCLPNAIITFEGTKLYVRSLEDFPEYDLTKIRISYIDLLQSTKARKKELEECYNFICNCTKCEQPDLKSNAMACPNSSCKNYCNVKEEKCSKCGQNLDKKFKEYFKKVTQFTESKMSYMKENNDMDLIEKCLEMQRSVLHDMNIKRIKTLELAMQVALNMNLWEKALLVGGQLIPGYLDYFTKYHNVTIDLYLTLAKIQIYLEKLSGAIITLEEIEPAILITHGEEYSYPKLMKSLFECKFSKHGVNANPQTIHKILNGHKF